jgi:hypothetical protein
LVTRRNLLTLGIGLIASANVIAFVLGNPLGFLAIPFGVAGFWLIMWGIFGRDFRGYPKAKKEDTQD